MLCEFFIKFLISIYFVFANVNAETATEQMNDLSDPSNDSGYEYFVFAQNYLISTCISWMTESPDNVCEPQYTKMSWSIHGIWPTRYASYYNYCNNSTTFDINALEPILDQLDRDMRGFLLDQSPRSFWLYEWIKHGTCAQTCDALDTELKFFSQMLKWLQQYNMGTILAKSNIIPGADYNITDIRTAIRSQLHVEVQIKCSQDQSNGNVYLYEIYLCFNKEFELMDCVSPSKCPVDKSIVTYPSSLPDRFILSTGNRFFLAIPHVLYVACWILVFHI